MAAALGDRASQPTDVVRRIYDDIAQYILELVHAAIEPVAALHHALLDHGEDSRRLGGGGMTPIG
jgi:hypothetical protein